VGQPTPLKNTLLLINAIELKFQKITITKDDECPTCGQSKTTDDVKFSSLNQQHQATCTLDALDDVGVTSEQFETLRNQDNCVVIDVRSDVERTAFHIGGEHIPLAELMSALDKIDPGKTILCYCQSGARSAQAARFLGENGLKGKSLKGGIEAWLKQL